MTEVKPRPPLVRIGQEVLGWLLVAAGLAALVLPGPGLVALAGGLYVLSLNYTWAARLLEPVKRRANKTAADSVQTWPRIVLSGLLALGIAAIGVVWGLHPDAPSWWPVAERWWLVGGWGTGVVLIASGVFALCLIGWSFVEFRIKHETLDEVLGELRHDQ
jgi:hypothetical protein